MEPQFPDLVEALRPFGVWGYHGSANSHTQPWNLGHRFRPHQMESSFPYVVAMMKAWQRDYPHEEVSISANELRMSCFSRHG